MIREILWRLVARIVSRPAVFIWLLQRAWRTPYTHITGPDGSVYMGRWWLFNPYPGSGGPRRWGEWLPSVRIHHIQRPDSDRHLHDHPWNARTIILRGWYQEELPATVFMDGSRSRNFRSRRAGDTGRLLFGEYHRIECISDGGVWTLFITWRYRGTWGFNVDGRKVPWREYLGVKG
jgi:hypothetical protein